MAQAQQNSRQMAPSPGQAFSLPLEFGLAALSAAAGTAASAWIYLHRVGRAAQLHYSGSHLPMLTEADGYYHLARAQQYLSGKAALADTPALSLLGALVHGLTRLPLELIAFWLPVALGAACCGWLWAWGRLLGAGRLECALAVLAGSLMPMWCWRSGPGWFDTDPGIALLLNACLYATARLGLSPGRPDLRRLPWLLASLALLGWWWRPGLAAAPLCLLLWGGGFFLATDPFWRRLRLGTGVGVAAVGALLLLLPESLLPGWIAAQRAYFLQHESLMSGGADEVVFRSINELRRLPAGEVLEAIGGNAPAGVLALAALALLCLRRLRPMLFLLPLLLIIPLTFLSAERMLYLAAVPVGLGVGLLPGGLKWLRGRAPFLQRLPDRLPLAAGLLLCALYLASCLQQLTASDLTLYFQEPEDRLAQAIKKTAPPEAKLWNWWDDGYFLAARSGLAPLFDGGSQTPLMSFLAARPMASENPRLARRWVRYFALNGGEAALAPLRQAWGEDETVFKNLDAVFAAEDPKAELAKLPVLPAGVQWLLPEGRVFLYLPQRFIRISHWWLAMGRSPHPAMKDVQVHVETFARGSFRYDPGARQVVLPQEVMDKGFRNFADVYVTDRTPIAEPFGGGQAGPFLVASDVSPWLYVTDREILGTVGFRLLAPGGRQLPGFAPVLTNYAHGGVWEVLP